MSVFVDVNVCLYPLIVTSLISRKSRSTHRCSISLLHILFAFTTPLQFISLLNGTDS